MKFHISRWRYWWGYLLVFILFFSAIWFSDRAVDAAAWLVGSLGIGFLVLFEYLIRVERIDVGDELLIIKSKLVRRVQYSQISNVSLSQTGLQNLLRYGDVLVKLPGEEIMLSRFEEAGKIERQINKHLHILHEQHPHHAKKPHVGP